MAQANRGCGDGSCSSESCAGCDKNQQKQSFLEQTHESNEIRNVIGVVSGKGGVGKSLVTSMLAVLVNRMGYKVGILDADVTGPSIPKMFGLNRKAQASELGIYPERTANDIKVMSVNLLLEKDDAPVIWRGPVISGVVKQFWTDVLWGELDVLFIDMPPGTGDVPLTVFQSIPLDGIVVVTSPQELVGMIVKKAYHMARQMEIPVLGVVENMSYVVCPDCGKEIHMFGESGLEKVTEELGTQLLGRLPIDPALAALADQGKFERFSADYLSSAAEGIRDRFLPETDTL